MAVRGALATTFAVRPPYRLDLTVDALRRTPSNVVDVVGERGVYRRALQDGRGCNLIEVRQTSATELEVRIRGARGNRWIPVIERMLGVHADLAQWERRAAAFAWLRSLMQRFRGVRPPRYPALWEAVAHAIVFQQISIAAASSIMRRVIEAASSPVTFERRAYFPFPTEAQLVAVSETALRAAGLSASKAANLRAAAEKLIGGDATLDEIEHLPTRAAAERLQAIRGIGPWSASVVLLRGLGRLDAFPLNDSGVARSIRILSGDPEIDIETVLKRLGSVRGMLYFHLLLGRMRRGSDASQSGLA